MRIREDMDRLEAAEKALGLRDGGEEELVEKIPDPPEEDAGGAEEEVEESSPDDAQPSEQEADESAVPEDPTGPLPEDGAPARKLAGRFERVEDLEHAYQEALTLAGRHGQELGTWRQQAEQARREAEEARQLLHRQQQTEQQDAEKQRWATILQTPYDRLSEDLREHLDSWAEYYGTDPLHFQATLRIQADQNAKWQAQQAKEREEIQQQARVQTLAGTMKAWIEAQPDRDELGPEVLAEIQRRPHLFNIPVGTSPEVELEHYQQTFSDLFEKARWKRQKAESDRQKAIVSEHKQQQGAAFDARRRAAGESANPAAPKAPLPSTSPKAKSPVDDVLDAKKRRTLANLING